MAGERADLVRRIETAEARRGQLETRTADLTGEIGRLRGAALAAQDKTVEARIASLEPAAGAAAVTGPGVRIVVDDAPTAADDARDRVLDLDLQVLVNGLWQAGAEAVSVNGHRLTALTAIRGAGDAITVDYRSLTRPYEVEAIGDPRALPGRLAQTTAGDWWNELARNRGMRYDVTDVDRLRLAGDPLPVLRVARRAEP